MTCVFHKCKENATVKNMCKYHAEYVDTFVKNSWDYVKSLENEKKRLEEENKMLKKSLSLAKDNLSLVNKENTKLRETVHTLNVNNFRLTELEIELNKLKEDVRYLTKVNAIQKDMINLYERV